MSSDTDKVRELANHLRSWFSASPNEVVAWLQSLEGHDVTKEILFETNLGLVVNRLAKTHRDKEINGIAKELVKKWRESVNGVKVAAKDLEKVNRKDDVQPTKTMEALKDDVEPTKTMQASEAIEAKNQLESVQMVSIDLRDVHRSIFKRCGLDAPVADGSKSAPMIPEVTTSEASKRRADVATSDPSERLPKKRNDVSPSRSGGREDATQDSDKDQPKEKKRRRISAESEAQCRGGFCSNSVVQDTAKILAALDSSTRETFHALARRVLDETRSGDGRPALSMVKRLACRMDGKVAQDCNSKTESLVVSPPADECTSSTGLPENSGEMKSDRSATSSSCSSSSSGGSSISSGKVPLSKLREKTTEYLEKIGMVYSSGVYYSVKSKRFQINFGGNGKMNRGQAATRGSGPDDEKAEIETHNKFHKKVAEYLGAQ